MKNTQSIRYTTRNVWRFCRPHIVDGPGRHMHPGFERFVHWTPRARGGRGSQLLRRSWTLDAPKLGFECQFRRKFGHYQRVESHDSQKDVVSTVDPENEKGYVAPIDIKDVDAKKKVQTSPRTRKPTPPPRPGKNPRTLYSWQPEYEQVVDLWPLLNTVLLTEIDEQLQRATKEAISLPESQHQAHYKTAYEEILKVSKYDVPITDPPPKTVTIMGVDQIWSEYCRICPCLCEDDIPYIQIHAPTEDGGKGVTFKMLLQEMSDWLYGENAEEIIEGERGRVGLTVIAYLEPGGGHPGTGLLEAKLYWYLDKAESGIKIGW
ncbi:hypothetical protein TWF718_003031 [Orbilia javanica]|uniref:Uncharacterized protein n=1 Tax=Orbilia javanica TaxID=47235 RepID=A0AAN8MTB6_9PEZI